MITAAARTGLPRRAWWAGMSSALAIACTSELEIDEGRDAAGRRDRDHEDRRQRHRELERERHRLVACLPRRDPPRRSDLGERAEHEDAADERRHGGPPAAIRKQRLEIDQRGVERRRT